MAAGDDGMVATAVAVLSPNAVVLDAAGNMYIAEPSTYMWIRRVDAASGVIRRVAGIGISGYSGDDGGDALTAEFNTPSYLVLMSGGQMVIADTGNNILRIVNCTSPSGAPSAAHDPQPWAARGSNRDARSWRCWWRAALPRSCDACR
jgi:hypothetical protein